MWWNLLAAVSENQAVKYRRKHLFPRASCAFPAFSKQSKLHVCSLVFLNSLQRQCARDHVTGGIFSLTLDFLTWLLTWWCLFWLDSLLSVWFWAQCAWSGAASVPTRGNTRLALQISKHPIRGGTVALFWVEPFSLSPTTVQTMGLGSRKSLSKYWEHGGEVSRWCKDQTTMWCPDSRWKGLILIFT